MGFQASTPKEQLEAGLKAVQQRDYSAAIPMLKEAIASLPHQSDAQVKGQMALVKAYRRTQDEPSAIELLRSMATHPNPQVTTWATQKLQDLQQTTPTPLSPTSPKPRRRAPNLNSDGSGADTSSNNRSNTRSASSANPGQTSRFDSGFGQAADHGSTSDSGEDTLAQPETYSAPKFQSAPTNAPAAKTWTPLPNLNAARLQRAQLAALLGFPLIPYAIHGLWFLISFFWFRIATSVLKWRMTSVSYEPAFPGPTQAIAKVLINNFEWPRLLSWIGLGLDIVLIGGLLWVGAPWILQLGLEKLFGLKKLNGPSLSRYSDPAYRLLQRGSQQAQIPFPDLGLLPTELPLIFSFGAHNPPFPFTRSPQIVVSQGLINRLTPEELATLYGSELAHLQNRSTAILSYIVGLLQIPYGLYWGFANLGDRLLRQAQSAVTWQAWGLTFLAYLLALASSLNYALFWLLRWSGLWLSRERQHQGDRTAVNLTGDPNGLARALLKYSQATSGAIEAQGYTHPLLEGLELLLPTSHRSALTFGKSLASGATEPLLAWDMANPNRHWLNLGNANNLLGDRLLWLMKWAKGWNLTVELDLGGVDLEDGSVGGRVGRVDRLDMGRLVRQVAPYGGLGLGYLLAVACWAIAWSSYWFKLPQLAWLGSDFKLFIGLPLIGWGLGTIWRFNQFFPDLPASWFRSGAKETDVAIEALLTDPLVLPLDAPRAVLQGTLLGRPGIANWLGQDLILKVDRQLIKLHYCTPLGPIGNWARNTHRPGDFVGKQVSLTGWLRRGATVWFDLEQLRTETGRTNQGSHQIYSTIVAVLAILLGILYCGLSKDF